jgi:Tfp pilus assembly protein PilF
MPHGNSVDPAALLRACIGHQKAGDWPAALQAASDACHAAPTLPQPHYAYGQAWLALNQPARAQEAFAAALALAPHWAEAWINYGLARYRQDAAAEACEAMRQALRCVPGHPVAIANLGALLKVRGETDIADALLAAELARDPTNAGARLNLAVALLADERAADALALLEAVAPPEEQRIRRHWLLQQALALLLLDRLDEAGVVLEQTAALGPMPPEAAPLWHWRQVLLAGARGDQDNARREAEQTAAALAVMGPDAVPEHRIIGHFDLAGFWAAQNEADAAFAQWAAGHALLRREQPFSRAARRAYVDATIAAFPRARFTVGARASHADPAPVFIVGMPRTGTTLCERILAAHAQVHGAGERRALGDTFAALGGDPHAITALGQEQLDAAAAAYLAELHRLAPDKARIVDKMPGNIEFLGLVALLLPGARIIHCVRDPRDIGLSIYMRRFYGAHPYAHDLADLGWMIAQQERLMAHWRAVLPNPILTVKLADWVEDFDATLARVLAHLDLPPDDACARFHEQPNRSHTASRLQVRQPVHASGLGRWKPYAAQLAPMIAELERAGMLAAWDEPRTEPLPTTPAASSAVLPETL